MNSFWQYKCVAETMVESNGNIASDFYMLTLIIANRNLFSVVEKNVCSLQCGIREETSGYKVRLTLSGFVFELSHATEFPERNCALHNPSQLGVLVNMALHKNSCHFRIKTYRKEHGGQFDGLLSQNIWSVSHRESVEVDDSVENIAIMLT